MIFINQTTHHGVVYFLNAKYLSFDLYKSEMPYAQRETSEKTKLICSDNRDEYTSSDWDEGSLIQWDLHTPPN